MATTTIKDVVTHLETFAPLAYQEDYDNSGLLVGDRSAAVTGILVTLDCTEAVIDEALAQGCNLIVAHHPIVFRGIKQLTGKNYVERTVIKAIKNDVAIYAIHTNLDNVANGVNQKIAERLGLINCRILQPRAKTLAKLVTFIPKDNAGEVLDALYAAGAGQIGNYSNCSFQTTGTGTFKPGEGTNPTIGEQHRQEFVEEVRAEVIFPEHLSSSILQALFAAHPYEEVAYYLESVNNVDQHVGSGLIGELKQPMEPIQFLSGLKTKMNAGSIRHTALLNQTVKTVAVCGGAGSFLLPSAMRQGADVLVSADFKYHEFFDADGKIIIADIGHYESEQFTKELLVDVIKEKFTTFAIIFSNTVTNPLSYL